MGCVPNYIKRYILSNSQKKIPIIEVIRIIFDFVVIVAMGVGLYFAFCANSISQQAMLKANTPFLKVTSTEKVPQGDNKLGFSYTIKNYSQTPALQLTVESKIQGRTIAGRDYQYVAVMPGETGNFGTLFEEPYSTGDFAIEYIIRYQNVLGEKFILMQNVESISGRYRDTKYEVSKRTGIDTHQIKIDRGIGNP